MSLDHYVSQVHLKNFYAPTLDNKQMYAFRKLDGHSFPTNSKAVCRIDEGNTNSYLSSPRAIEEFLQTIEPYYNRAIASLRENRIEQNTIYVVSGFIAYVSSCSPASMRLCSAPNRSSLESLARSLDKTGAFGNAPEALGGASLTELLDSGAINLTVDEKYPQAIGISQVMARMQRFGNCVWEILLNDKEGSPFFTSDYPIALESTPNPMTVQKIVPLAPDIAVRLIPDALYKVEEGDYTFENFRYVVKRPTVRQIARINQLIVQSAETLVFSCLNEDWVKKFISKNSHFRIETKTVFIPHNDGNLQISSQVLQPISKQPTI